MSQKKQLTISEFSRLTGIKRENLRFYDRIGLLSPEERGDNNYRYYSRHQLNTAYLISNLRWIGMGIEEIKQYSAHRTPEKSLALFARQDARLQAEIDRLQETRRIMKLHSDMVREALSHGDNALFLEEKAREPIFLCPPTPPHLDGAEAENLSYEYAEEQGVNLSYPLGARLPQQRLETGEPASLRYYFKAENHGNAWKPDGLYAVAYGRYDPWHSEPLYRRLLEFIRTQDLCICGDAYEEYPLSDVSVQLPEHYGIRVEIPVLKAEDRDG